jgi:N-methylhydantoinase B
MRDPRDVVRVATRLWAPGRLGEDVRIGVVEAQGGSYNHLEAGEVLVNNTGGGGGYGHPFGREPGRVADDVRNGYVSAGAARCDYGVVIDPVTFAVDETATARCRERQA